MSEWQPIETAPKDGTWIILNCLGGIEERDYDAKSCPNVTIGCYQEAFDKWRSVEARYEFYDYGGYTGAGVNIDLVYVNATHWMPLPEPPKEGELTMSEQWVSGMRIGAEWAYEATITDLRQRITELESALREVAILPEKWCESAAHGRLTFIDCADELRAILEKYSDGYCIPRENAS